jgi:hypothetical protein
MTYLCKSAVLLLCFNRPEHTRKVFNQIRLVRPSRLYLAIDGPRLSSPGDVAKIDEVKKILSEINWECSIQRLYRSTNLGCREAVKGALDWFFYHEEEGIILEDDIYALPSFFKFCDEMLSNYRESSEVCVISGSNSIANLYVPETRYFYSIYNHCWGWASWRRSWLNYENDLNALNKKITPYFLRKIGGGWCFSIVWMTILRSVINRNVNSWAYIWTFSCWIKKGLAVLPSSPLTINIGFDDQATHTSHQIPNFLKNTNLVEMDFSLHSPKVFQRDVNADRLIGMVVFGISYLGAFKSLVKLIPGVSIIIKRIRN